MSDVKFYCGYIINNDKSIMLHVRRESSDTINYYSKVNIPNEFDEKDITKFILVELLAIASMDFAIDNIILREPSSLIENKEYIEILIAFIDEFGNARVDTTHKENYENAIKDIKETYKPLHISAISLGTCYGFKDVETEMINSATFNIKPAPNNLIATSLEDYYKLNESIICTLKYKNE